MGFAVPVDHRVETKLKDYQIFRSCQRTRKTVEPEDNGVTIRSWYGSNDLQKELESGFEPWKILIIKKIKNPALSISARIQRIILETRGDLLLNPTN